MSHSYLFFDLDGTLTDSQSGIIHSVEHALKYFNIHVPPEQLLPFIGPPLRDSFAPLLDHDAASVDLAIQKYREYYSVKGVFENRLYDGIKELLGELQGEGHCLCLATSKPEPFAQQILDYFQISGFFNVVAGAELHGTRNAKADVLRYACSQLNMPPVSQCLMVGDRKYDVQGAHAAGMPCAGVLYGYGSREELAEAGADYLCSDMAELQALLVSKGRAV